MDKLIAAAGLLLFLAGLVGVIYGAGINVPGMIARRATDYSGITAYIIEWVMMGIAGLLMFGKGVRSK